MYNDENNRSDRLGEQLKRIGGQMNPSPQLKKAAKTGTPLHRAGIRYTPATHIRRFSKAILAYAAGVLLFLGAVMMLPKLWNTNEPVNHPANSPNSSAQCNHKYVALTIGLPDSCTEGRIHAYRCQYCGDSYSEQDPPLGHNYVDGVCTRCGTLEGELPPLEITIPIPDPGEMSAELEAEIIAASAKQYDEIATYFSIEFVADLGSGAYAIFLDGPWEYPCMVTEQIVHGYLFRYSSGRTMDIYKDGAVYGLSEAYDQGVIDANQVLDLYLIYADRMGYLSVRNPEKYYTWATIEDDFDADEIIIVIFPEYTLYPYTVEDFAEIGCVELRNLWFDEDDPSEVRIIWLKLDKNSKQNVLNCIKILEHRVDLESAEPNFPIELHEAA